MTVRLLYFAWVREKLGHAEESVALPPHIATVADLLAWQSTRGPEFAAVFTQAGIVRVAVDQLHADAATTISGAREIAFFPPVTGG
jgi:sulfur-carrier protein